MLKKILKLIQKFVVSALVLYAYNLIATPLDLIIPINIVTISVLMILGTPALFSLITILLLMY